MRASHRSLLSSLSRLSLSSSSAEAVSSNSSVFSASVQSMGLSSPYASDAAASAHTRSEDPSTSSVSGRKFAPRGIPNVSERRDIYGGNRSQPYQHGTETSPASVAYRNPLFKVLPGGRISPMPLASWISRRKGPFRPKQRMYAMGMNILPLLGAESLPATAQEIADKAKSEGRELTTRERIYSVLLSQRHKQISPEYTIRENLEPQSEPIAVQDKQVFAVVEIKGYQHKIHPDDTLYTQKVSEWQVNDIVELNNVLLLGSKYETVIGRPYVPSAKVVCLVEERFKDAHQLHLRKRKRNNRHKKLIGFRRELMKLRVLEIVGINEVPTGQLPITVPTKALGPAPPPRVPKHMRNYIKLAENLYADPKSFRYIGLKNGLVAQDRLRRRRAREGIARAGSDAGKE